MTFFCLFVLEKKNSFKNHCIKVLKISYAYKKIKLRFCDQQRRFHQKPKALLTLNPIK